MNHDERMDRVKVNDKRLIKAEELNPLLEAFPVTLEEAWENMSQLIDYYTNGWLADAQELDGPDGQYGVLSEDGVWNEMGTFYHAMKEIAEVSARIVAEYESDR